MFIVFTIKLVTGYSMGHILQCIYADSSDPASFQGRDSISIWMVSAIFAITDKNFDVRFNVVA